jgi:Caudovirus prohead serine protease
LKVRARFSAISKAQDIRTRMVEGHIRGMSFTYDAIRHYLGEKDGRKVRFLQEIRLYEATVTPFPMNELALASAKGSSADAAEDLARLERVEAWAAGANARGVLADMLANPYAMQAAAGVLVEAKTQHRLAELEQWAASTPYHRLDPQEQAAQLHRARRDRDNAYGAAMAAWKATVRDCGHRSCLPGACKYGG